MMAFQYPGSATVDAALDQLAERAIALAARFVVNARQQQNDQKLTHSSKIARRMEDPPDKALALALADRAFHSRNPARIADQLKHLIEQYGGAPPGRSPGGDQTALQNTQSDSPGRRTRACASAIGPAPGSASASWAEPAWANARPAAVCTPLSLLGRDAVEYLSVRISSLVSQLSLIAFEQTLATVTHRLRILYRAAMLHTYITPSGQRVEQGGVPLKPRGVRGATLAMQRIKAAQCGWEQAVSETTPRYGNSLARPRAGQA